MTKQEAGQLCCKVLGIYTLVSAIAVSGNAFLSIMMVRQGGMFARISAFLPPFLLLAFSGYLWVYAGAIAARMFPDEEPAEHATGVTPEILKRIAFVVVGLLFVNSAFTGLAQVAANLMMPRMTVYSMVYFGESTIRLVIGFWLIFGTQRLRSWLTVGSEKLQGFIKKDW